MARRARLAGHRPAGDRARSPARGSSSRARAAGRSSPRPGRPRRADRAPDLSLAVGRARRRAPSTTPRCRSCSPSRPRARSRCRAATSTPSCSRSPPLGAALARAARRPGRWDRGPVEGREELRAWFAREAGGAPARARHGRLPRRPVGAGDRVPRARRARARRSSSSRPTYVGALAAARAAGLRVVPGREPTPTACGPTSSPTRCGAPARGVSTASRCSPTRTARRSPPTAARPCSTRVAAAGAFLVEDDWARDLAIDGDPPPPLAAADRDGHVVYLRSLTKSAAPGLRVAAIGARGAAGARLRAVARSSTTSSSPGRCRRPRSSSSPRPPGARHLRRLRAALRERRDALAAALERRAARRCASPAVPAGGLHLWAALPDGRRRRRARRRARRPAASSSTPAGPGSPPSRPARSCA